MSAFVQCSVAVIVLASVGHAVAQPGEADQHPPRSVTFGVVTSTQVQLQAQTDAPGADTGGTDANSENRVHSGDFFVSQRGSQIAPLPPLQHAGVRASLEQRYPDLAEGVGIDAPTAGKLLDLLADHQLEAFERAHLDAQTTPADWVLQEAEAESKRLAALRDLLGEAAMERYLDYSTTVRERYQVRALDARLPTEHKLLPAQKQRLIALYQEDYARMSEVEEQRQSADRRPFLPGEDLQRAARLATIAANEEHLRTMTLSQRWTSERAASFLTAPQLAALSQLHTEQHTNLRRWIERARVDAGLEPTIPDIESQVPRMKRGAQLSVQIELTIDREQPLLINSVMTVGEPVTLEIGKGLLVRAKPQLYENGSPTVRLDYYEQQGARRRHLTSISTVSNLSMGKEGEKIDTETFVVASGRDAYAVRANVSVAAL